MTNYKQETKGMQKQINGYNIFPIILARSDSGIMAKTKSIKHWEYKAKMTPPQKS